MHFRFQRQGWEASIGAQCAGLLEGHGMRIQPSLGLSQLRPKLFTLRIQLAVKTMMVAVHLTGQKIIHWAPGRGAWQTQVQASR